MAVNSLLCWNCGGFAQHCAELCYFLETAEPKPDVICIQECNTYTTLMMPIPGYFLLKLDRSSRLGGGVCFLVADHVKYSVLKPLVADKESPLEVIGISCGSGMDNAILNITNVYCPPNKALQKDMLANLSIKKHHLFVGDFNAKHPLWGSPTADVRGKLIHDYFTLNHDFICLNDGQGTRIDSSGYRSHLDLAFCSSSLAAKFNFSILDSTWGSDHYPFLLTQKTPIANSCNPIANEIYLYKRADWSKYKTEIDNFIYSNSVFKETSDIEYLNSQFTACVTVSKNLAIPKGNSCSSKKRMTPYWNSECTKAIRLRRKAEFRLEAVKSINN